MRLSMPAERRGPGVPGLCLFAAAAWLCCVPTASAELVFFTSGRSMNVASHRAEADAIVLALRGGGEMAIEASLIDHFAADEVPYPTPPVPVMDSTQAFEPGAGVVTDPRFDPIITRVAAEQGIDPTLVRAVIQVESNYEPRARSAKGAVGLMQVMPATARQYGITNLYDPSSNIRAGVAYLKDLLSRLPLALALAAYNAGEAAVQRFAGIPPYGETIQYVARVRSLLGQ
jgi:soluble lytic murein transglycosylase-like protein